MTLLSTTCTNNNNNTEDTLLKRTGGSFKSTASSASGDATGKWVITLADGTTLPMNQPRVYRPKVKTTKEEKQAATAQ